MIRQRTENKISAFVVLAKDKSTKLPHKAAESLVINIVLIAEKYFELKKYKIFWARGKFRALTAVLTQGKLFNLSKLSKPKTKLTECQHPKELHPIFGY